MQRGKASLLAAMAFALSAAACNTTGQPAGGSPAGTVAFESIDGPPPAVFQRLVHKLDAEAEARRVPVVTREGFAAYRVRGYVAVGVRKRQAVVAWVWDVYDAQAGRSLRLSGEEQAGPASHDAWQTASDEVLGRIARSGMEQLSAFLQSSPQGPALAPPEPSALARNDALSAEPGGTVRRSTESAADTAAPPAPLPPRRPAARSGRVALAEPAR